MSPVSVSAAARSDNIESHVKFFSIVYFRISQYCSIIWLSIAALADLLIDSERAPRAFRRSGARSC